MLSDLLLRNPFSVIGQCSFSADLSLDAGKCAIINLSHAASDMILKIHRRLPVSIFSAKSPL
jgi:hypothetical protein